MENLSIRQLKDKLPVKHLYAEKVVERAKENGIELTTRDVYNAYNGRTRVNEPVIKKILEILLKEEEEKIASIV